MKLPNTSEIDAVQEELNETLTAGLDHIKTELASFSKISEEKITLLRTKVSELVKELLELNKTYEIIKGDVAKLQKQKEIMLNYNKELDEKAKTLDKQETDLLALHKVLENKRLVIQAQESELNEKKRRSVV